MILIRNVKEKEGGMFIFSIMAGLHSHLSLCVLYSSLFRRAILLRGGLFYCDCDKLIEFDLFMSFHVLAHAVLFLVNRKQTIGGEKNDMRILLMVPFFNKFSIALAKHYAHPSCILANSREWLNGVFLISGSCTN